MRFGDQPCRDFGVRQIARQGDGFSPQRVEFTDKLVQVRAHSSRACNELRRFSSGN
jgi:hypothetical protein